MHDHHTIVRHPQHTWCHLVTRGPILAVGSDFMFVVKLTGIIYIPIVIIISLDRDQTVFARYVGQKSYYTLSGKTFATKVPCMFFEYILEVLYRIKGVLDCSLRVHTYIRPSLITYILKENCSKKIYTNLIFCKPSKVSNQIHKKSSKMHCVT
jgi:hypothetical protein